MTISDEAARIIMSNWYKEVGFSASEVEKHIATHLRTKAFFIAYETTILKHDGTNWYLEAK